MSTSIPNPERYGISPKFGFLSQYEPLRAFSNPYYKSWDLTIAELPLWIRSGTVEKGIGNMPLLNVSKLQSELEYRRAYVVLAYLTHAYVWTKEPPNDVVPSQLSEPFLEVCDNLGMNPVLSYAGLCIWNWAWKGDGKLIMDLEDIEPLATFTGTQDETVFYHVPVIIEAECGTLVHLLLDSIDAANNGSIQPIISALNLCANSFVQISGHLAKLYPLVDPQRFYHQIRPFFAGGKGMEEKGLPRGMIFKRNDGSETDAKYVGGSAVQSCLFHVLDHLLGVVEGLPGLEEGDSVFKAS